MQFKLQRVYIGDQGAFGVLSKNDDPPFAVTLERTFRPDNEVVIPFGVHKCIRTMFNKGGYPTYEVLLPETKHTLVKFHRGNLEEHSLGCVLVAESYQQFGAMFGIGNSKAGFNEFMEHTCSVDEFMLLVC
jgi:hypothetical protein